MKVIWSQQAEAALDRTAAYIGYEYGQRVQSTFLREVLRTSRLLAMNPNMGPVEPLLCDMPDEYRSIVVNHLNKIVYCIADAHIEVVAFWDIRREPSALIHELE